MATKRSDWCIVAISGVTNGGKTTLAQKLKQTLYPSVLICQDEYFYPDDSDKHVKVQGLDHNNYDIMSSLDMKRMHEDILKILNQSALDLADEADLVGDRSEVLSFPDKKILIIEGFLVLNFEPIAEMSDYKCYLDLSKEECLNRRVNRVYDPPDTPGYFELCVWPEYLKYRSEIERMIDVNIFDGSDSDISRKVFDDIRNLNSRRKLF